MDRSLLPLRYEGLSVREVQVHFRHCVGAFTHCEFAELVLGEADVAVPVIKRTRRVKEPGLDIALRTEAIGREALEELGEKLRADGYRLTSRKTPKRKLLSKISVSLPVSDPMLPAMGAAVLAAIAGQLESPWSQDVTAAYFAKRKNAGLPGEMVNDDPAYKLGQKVGKANSAALGIKG